MVRADSNFARVRAAQGDDPNKHGNDPVRVKGAARLQSAAAAFAAGVVRRTSTLTGVRSGRKRGSGSGHGDHGTRAGAGAGTGSGDDDGASFSMSNPMSAKPGGLAEARKRSMSSPAPRRHLGVDVEVNDASGGKVELSPQLQAFASHYRSFPTSPRTAAGGSASGDDGGAGSDDGGAAPKEVLRVDTHNMPKYLGDLDVPTDNEVIDPVHEGVVMPEWCLRLVPEPDSRRRHVVEFLCRIHHPRHGWRMYWDLVVLVVLVFCLVDIPLRVAFELDEPPGSFEDVLALMVDVFFLTDVLINFRTGYFDQQGRYHTDPKVIANNYVRGWFWIDFLTSIPFSRILLGFSVGEAEAQTVRLSRLLRVLRIVRLIKLLRFLKLFRVMGQWQDRQPGAADTLKLAKFVLIIFFLAHLCGCGFMLLASMGADEETGEFREDSWITDNGLGNEPWHHRYMMALYWSLATLTTVGYGDVTPQNGPELAWACLVMFSGCLVFGWVIGGMASLITHEDAVQAMVRRKMQSISSWMRNRSMPVEMQTKIADHFELVWRNSSVMEEAELLEDLPTSLRADVNLFLHRGIISRVPFLRALSPAALSIIVGRLHPQAISAGNLVFRKGEPGLEMFFITTGAVEVMKPVAEEPFTAEDVVVTLGKGAHFGEFALLPLDSIAKRSCSVRAATFVEMTSLSRGDFFEVISMFPEVYEALLTEAKARRGVTRAVSSNSAHLDVPRGDHDAAESQRDIGASSTASSGDGPAHAHAHKPRKPSAITVVSVSSSAVGDFGDDDDAEGGSARRPSDAGSAGSVAMSKRRWTKALDAAVVTAVARDGTTPVAATPPQWYDVASRSSSLTGTPQAAAAAAAAVAAAEPASPRGRSVSGDDNGIDDDNDGDDDGDSDAPDGGGASGGSPGGSSGDVASADTGVRGGGGGGGGAGGSAGGAPVVRVDELMDAMQALMNPVHERQRALEASVAALTESVGALAKSMATEDFAV